MGEKIAFQTEKAAICGTSFSQAIIYNKELIFISGQGSIDSETNKPVHGTIEEETKRTMENIRIVLEQAGSCLNKILQVNVYLSNIREYDMFNSIYVQYFECDLPARSCIQAAKIPFSLKVEIDAIAYI